MKNRFRRQFSARASELQLPTLSNRQVDEKRCIDKYRLEEKKSERAGGALGPPSN